MKAVKVGPDLRLHDFVKTQTRSKKLDCLQSVPYFSIRSSKSSDTGSNLDRVWREDDSKPRRPPLGTFENNYKMAAGYDKRSISTI